MITFTYRMMGSGWSEATLGDGAETVTLDGISYLSDALRDLIGGVLALLDGGKRAEFSWFTEPGEFAWLLTHHKQVFSLRVTRFKDWEDFRGKYDRGKTVFKGRGTLQQFSESVLAQLDELYATVGPGGYQKQWGSSFPFDEYQRLRARLSASEH